MHLLFEQPTPGVWNRQHGFALATGLRALQYPTTTYINAWRDLIGANSAANNLDPSGWPPHYSILSHDDGTILLFGGVRNQQQALTIAGASTFVDVTNYGRVMLYAWQLYEDLKTSILATVRGCTNLNRFVVAGHSAGGILAMLFAKRLTTEFGAGKVKYAMSFGAVRGVDKAWNDSMPCPAFAVVADTDSFPFWPLSSTVPTYNRIGWATPVDPCICGHFVGLNKQGEVQWDRGLTGHLIDRANPLRSLADMMTGVGILDAHSIANYASQCSKQHGAGREDEMPGLLRRLNNAMHLGVGPADFSQSVPPPATTPVATPPAPAVPQLQRLITNTMDPVTPAAPTFNTDLVGATQVATSTATVTSAPVAGATLDFLRGDAQLVRDVGVVIERIRQRDSRLLIARRSRRVGSPLGLLRYAKAVFDRVAARDAKAADPAQRGRLSTSAYLIDPDDPNLFWAFTTYRDAISDRIAAPGDNRVPIINRADEVLAASEELLLGQFAPLNKRAVRQRRRRAASS